MAGDRLEDCLGDTDNFLKLMPQRINLSIKHLAFDIPDRKKILNLTTHPQDSTKCCCTAFPINGNNFYL